MDSSHPLRLFGRLDSSHARHCLVPCLPAALLRCTALMQTHTRTDTHAHLTHVHRSDRIQALHRSAAVVLGCEALVYRAVRRGTRAASKSSARQRQSVNAPASEVEWVALAKQGARIHTHGSPKIGAGLDPVPPAACRGPGPIRQLLGDSCALAALSALYGYFRMQGHTR